MIIPPSKHNRICGVYEIVNTVNGKRYIGSSVNIPKRWRTHKELLRLGKHHSIDLQRAWNKHGKECFSFSIVELCDKDEIMAREQFHIDLSCPEYNISLFSSSIMKNRKHSIGSREKMSASHSGTNNGMYGKRHTPDSIRKMKDGKSGSIPWNKGKQGLQKASIKTREKMSMLRKGIVHNGTWNKGHTPWNKGVTGLYCGANHVMAKSVAQYSKSMDLIAIYGGMNEAARATSINQSGISKCCSGKQNYAGGYIWHYADGVNDV